MQQLFCSSFLKGAAQEHRSPATRFATWIHGGASLFCATLVSSFPLLCLRRKAAHLTVGRFSFAILHFFLASYIVYVYDRCMESQNKRGEQITLYFAAGLKTLAQSCAATAGLSLSRYVADAVTDRMKRDAIKADLRLHRKLGKAAS